MKSPIVAGDVVLDRVTLRYGRVLRVGEVGADGQQSVAVQLGGQNGVTVSRLVSELLPRPPKGEAMKRQAVVLVLMLETSGSTRGARQNPTTAPVESFDLTAEQSDLLQAFADLRGYSLAEAVAHITQVFIDTHPRVQDPERPQ